MCGRVTQRISSSEFARIFDAEDLTGLRGERYNVAPTQDLAVVVERDDRRAVAAYRWGLVPHWADDPKVGNRHINARAETVATAPTFRDSFARKRCIVPVSGFYEWQRRSDGTRSPVYVTTADGSPLALAGLGASWRPEDGGATLRTATIITTTPNDVLAPVHNRMPAILARDAWSFWLDPATSDRAALRALLRPVPDDGLVVYPVARRVNDPRNDGPDLLEPIGNDPVLRAGRG